MNQDPNNDNQQLDDLENNPFSQAESQAVDKMVQQVQNVTRNISEKAKKATQEALKKINNINNTKNAIMIAENLIIAKGFKNVVIFANEGSISVVIQADELKPEEVAQIQNIVSRELNVSAETIHISNK